jgi:hypothetical protein
MTGGAVIWGARLEVSVERTAHLRCCSRLGRTWMGPAQGPQQREKEQEEEQEHLMVHEAFSWLEMRRRDTLLLRWKNTECREGKSSG